MPRVYALLGDAVLVAHLVFILFIAFGSVLAWKWPRLLWLHVPAFAWGIGIVAVGYRCPLTALENSFRRRAGGGGYDEGFMERYIDGVIYPERFMLLLRALTGAVIVVGYAGVLRRHHRRAAAAPVTG